MELQWQAAPCRENVQWLDRNKSAETSVTVGQLHLSLDFASFNIEPSCGAKPNPHFSKMDPVLAPLIAEANSRKREAERDKEAKKDVIRQIINLRQRLELGKINPCLHL